MNTCIQPKKISVKKIYQEINAGFIVLPFLLMFFIFIDFKIQTIQTLIQANKNTGGVLAGLWVIVVHRRHPNGGFPLSMVKMSSFKTENYERSVLRVLVSIKITRILMRST